MQNDFAVFILTHGRPKNVYTFDTLKKYGFKGRTYIVIDNEDKKADEYYHQFGKENVIMFDKKAIAKESDEFDNFNDRRAIIYARNSCFSIAKKLGITYFLQLDDDYTGFYYKLVVDEKPVNQQIKNLDAVINDTLAFYKTTTAKSIAFAQGGDFIGGIDNGAGCFRFSKRKAMNSFFCSTERPFKFIGRINEDVNTYTNFQSKGNLFMTVQNVCIIQKQTQSNKGGMTELYLDSGTYIKSFYSVICSPNCVDINLMRTSNGRLHHSIDWDTAVPCIVSEDHKKNKLMCNADEDDEVLNGISDPLLIVVDYTPKEKELEEPAPLHQMMEKNQDADEVVETTEQEVEIIDDYTGEFVVSYSYGLEKKEGWTKPTRHTGSKEDCQNFINEWKLNTEIKFT